MQWSKIRKLVEERFAPSVRGRVTLHTTAYRCSCGRGWIAIDGQDIANMDTILAWELYGSRRRFDSAGHSIVDDSQRAPGRLVEPGEFTRVQLHEACWAYLHSSLNESIASPQPLVRSIAVLDARVGRNRLVLVGSGSLHPLTRYLLRFRQQAERQATLPALAGASTRQ